jgi:hypothetical protein
LLYPAELQAQEKSPDLQKISLNKNYMGLEEVLSRISGSSVN